MRAGVRFAIVGARGYARTLLKCIEALGRQGRGELVAAMLRNRAAYPEIGAELEAQGVRVFDDYEAMLAACQGQAEVIVLPTAIHFHAPMSIASLGAGYHLLVEKPVAGSLAEVDEMIAAREDSGRQCAVGFQAIYSRVLQTLKGYICEGRLGRVERLRGMALWPREPSYYARNRWAGKMLCDGRPVYDSPFNNALAHQIMNMLYLASPEEGGVAYPVGTEAKLYRAYEIESFDTGCWRARTDTDVEVLFAASHACAERADPVMVVEAEQATATYAYDERATIAYRDGRRETIEQDDARARMFDNLLMAVTGQVDKPLCTLEVGRAHVASIEAMHRVAEVVSVAPRFLSVGEGGGRAIVGVEEAVRRAFASGRLFSELDAAFAHGRDDELSRTSR
jgi:predicted dehydrogenase